MNLTKGKIVAGERLSLLNEKGERRYAFTVETEGAAEITMGNSVTTFAIEGFDDQRLEELLAYLEDRPALMDEEEVKAGVYALKCLLGKK